MTVVQLRLREAGKDATASVVLEATDPELIQWLQARGEELFVPRPYDLYVKDEGTSELVIKVALRNVATHASLSGAVSNGQAGAHECAT
jgi:hypothetical protein